LPWYPQAIVFVVAALVLALRMVRPLRAWALTTDIRSLIAFHLIRFVGFYFLFLYSLGELPYNFAVFGGWGDIAVAVLALVVMFFCAKSRSALVVWNLLGLADIVAVAATAARDEMAVPGSMHLLDRFPLILLPTCIVPLILVTHLLMLVRAARYRSWMGVAPVD
jgi:hypothetical protein